MSNSNQRGGDQIESIFGMLAMDQRRRIVKALLAGNDTQCFTTEQYAERYIANHGKINGDEEGTTDYYTHNYREYLRQQMKGGMALMHLRSMPEVKEVKPGVWTA